VDQPVPDRLHVASRQGRVRTQGADEFVVRAVQGVDVPHAEEAHVPDEFHLGELEERRVGDNVFHGATSPTLPGSRR
jgi:hypothetical protein